MGDVSHLLQKQHETVFLVKSYRMWVSGGGSIYTYIYIQLVYACVYVSKCCYMCMCVYICMYMYIYMYMSTHMYMHMYMYTCVYVEAVDAYMYICLRLCTCIYTCQCMCILFHCWPYAKMSLARERVCQSQVGICSSVPANRSRPNPGWD